MNKREKLLASIVGGVLAIFVIGFGVRGVILKPLKTIDSQIKASKLKVDTANAERRKYFEAEDRVKKWALTTFGEDSEQASSVSGEMLTRQINRANLEEMAFTRLPLPPRLNMKGASEIGWSVQGEGPLPNVVNLIFALENSPYLHRIDSLAFNPGSAPGSVKVRFRFLTLVFLPPPDVARKELKDTLELDSPERKVYDALIARDILRPYVKRPAPPPGSNQKGSPGQGTSPAVPPGPESFKIVSLSEWLGQPEVHVLDATAQKTKRYLPGDELAGGKIVCVDYRPLPMPGKAGLLSESRVILRQGDEFFAIERGGSLADKRKLAPAELPREVAQLVQ